MPTYTGPTELDASDVDSPALADVADDVAPFVPGPYTLVAGDPF